MRSIVTYKFTLILFGFWIGFRWLGGAHTVIDAGFARLVVAPAKASHVLAKE